MSKFPPLALKELICLVGHIHITNNSRSIRIVTYLLVVFFLKVHQAEQKMHNNFVQESKDRLHRREDGLAG